MTNKEKKETEEWLDKQLKSKEFEKIVKRIIGDAFIEYSKLQYDNRYFIKNRFK